MPRLTTMTTKFGNASSSSPEDLRRAFESAISKTLGSERMNPSHRPIAQRNSDEVCEKRALTDAARALAQLWNISPTLIR